MKYANAQQSSISTGFGIGNARRGSRIQVLNRGTYWDRTVLELQQRTEQLQNRYFVETSLYRQFEISEESWKEITKPFFKAAKHEIPQKTLEEVFGELLKDN